MNLIEKVKGLFGGSTSTKMKDLAAQHGDKVAGGVDKATDFVDDKTKGKYTDKLQQIDDAVDKAVDRPDGGKV
jgi:hypothetical protein